MVLADPGGGPSVNLAMTPNPRILAYCLKKHMSFTMLGPVVPFNRQSGYDPGMWHSQSMCGIDRKAKGVSEQETG